MQAILYIPSVAALGRQPRQPSHIVGDEALMVMHDPSDEWLSHAVVIGRVVNDNGQPAPLIAPEHHATYDRLWPRTPVTWTDEDEVEHVRTPPALFGCLGLPPPEPLATSPWCGEDGPE